MTSVVDALPAAVVTRTTAVTRSRGRVLTILRPAFVRRRVARCEPEPPESVTVPSGSREPWPCGGSVPSRTTMRMRSGVVPSGMTTRPFARTFATNCLAGG